jgi:dipeptidyl-peptidase-4
MKDGNTYSRQESDSINVYSYETGDYIKTLAIGKEMIPEGDTTPIELSGYTFSKDESKLLIPTATEYIFRYSSVSEFYIWDMATKKLTRLSAGGKQRLATFSPDGTKVAFVRDNNLIVSDLVNNIEIQVTTDGKQNAIINGTTDWVYEEEFAITQGFEWSPDGKRIAFYRFDESNVPEYTMMEWGDLYPKKNLNTPNRRPNSLVAVRFDLATQQSIPVDLGTETDQYVPAFLDKDPVKLMVLKLNRLQNELTLLYTDAATGKTTPVFQEGNRYYIEESNYDNFIFIDNSRFLMTSERSGYFHIFLHTLDRSAKFIELTTGNWDVTDVYGYDETSGLVWFAAASSSLSTVQYGPLTLRAKCVRFLMKQAPTDRSLAAILSFTSIISDANTPSVYTVNSRTEVIRTIEDNEAQRKTREIIISAKDSSILPFQKVWN